VGGITSMIVLPDNEPPFDDASLIEFVARRARQIKLANMYAYGALTVGLEGKELAEIGLMAEAGAVAFTDADHAVGNAQVLRRALYYAKGFDALIVHLPQEPTLSGGTMTSGVMATRLGLSGVPPLAEVMLVERDIPPGRDDRRTAPSQQDLDGGIGQGDRIGQGARAQDHLRHRPALLRAERSRGRRLSHLRQAGAAACAPRPIARGRRRAEDRRDRRHRVGPSPAGPGQQARCRSHRPSRAASGSRPCCRSRSSWCTTASSPCRSSSSGCRQRPARLLNLPGGKLAKGAPADLVLFDSDYAWRIDRADFWSKTKNSPFDERPVQGQVMATIVGGRTIYRHDNFTPTAAVA
jgi:dihydroorotase